MAEPEYFCKSCGYQVKKNDVICATCDANLDEVGKKKLDELALLGPALFVIDRAQKIRAHAKKDLKGRPIEPCIRCDLAQSSSLWENEGVTINYGNVALLRVCDKCKPEFSKRLIRLMNLDQLIDEHPTIPSRLRWQRFRKDNFTCQKCGRSAMENDIVLRCHHLNPAKGNKLDNLTTRCDFCHP